MINIKTNKNQNFIKVIDFLNLDASYLIGELGIDKGYASRILNGKQNVSTNIIKKLLLYYCGVRRNEMCRLRFSDIDLEKGIIHIYDHAAKNYRTRHSTIPAVILPHFSDGTFDHFPKNHYIFGEKWQPNPKKPLCPNTRSKVHRRILEGIVEAGKLPAEALVGLDFYAWKDTAITLHIHRTNPVSTRDQIGHASLDQTMQYYHAVLVNEEYRRLSDTLHE